MKRRTACNVVLLGAGVLLAAPAAYPQQCMQPYGGSFLDLSRVQGFPSVAFGAEESAVLSGKDQGRPRSGLGQVGIALDPYARDGRTYPQDAYGAQSFEVTRGTLSDAAGRFDPIPAYKVSAPRYGASFEWLASPSRLFYRFEQRVETRVVMLQPLDTGLVAGEGVIEGFRMTELDVVRAEAIAPGEFTKVEDVVLNDLEHEAYFLFLPPGVDIPTYWPVREGVEVVRLTDAPFGAAYKLTFDVSSVGETFDSYTGYTEGPGTHRDVYGRNAEIVTASGVGGRLHAAWWDYAGSRIYVTTVEPDGAYSTVAMPVALGRLGAFTTDPEGHFYYVTIGEGNDPEVLLVKTDGDGKERARRRLDNGWDDFNIWQFDRDVASLAYGAGRIGLVLARRMQRGPDGLNHQGSISAVFDAGRLDLIRNHGQNAGHSLDSRIVFDCTRFISADLGDNYPRGIIVHTIDDAGKTGRLVYTFKTKHGAEPSPYRTGNDGKPLPPGRWSNDNLTYTELGGIAVGKEGYAVLFTSERTQDNALALDYVNESRNLGFVLVSPTFDQVAQEEAIVVDQIVISRGESSADFGFYTFDGNFTSQRSVGVVWLTQYDSPMLANASRAKLAHLGDGEYLALWELWADEGYLSTYGMTFTEDGRTTSNPVELGRGLRLHRGDHVALHGGHVAWFTGSGATLELNLVAIR